jgi:hypothetical protein
VLAAVGLFGVRSYIAAQRTTEIGIRIARGAKREQLMRKMLRDGIRPAARGLVVGLAASLEAGRLMRDLLYQIKPLSLCRSCRNVARGGRVRMYRSGMACTAPRSDASIENRMGRYSGIHGVNVRIRNLGAQCASADCR